GKALLRNVVFTKLGMAYASAGLSLNMGPSRMLDAKRIASDEVLKKQLIELQGNRKLADALAHWIKAGDSIAFKELAKASDELKKALALIQGAGKAETVLAVPVTCELARTLTKLNRLPEAEKYYQAAIDIARREQMFQMPKQATLVNEAGELLLK